MATVPKDTMKTVQLIRSAFAFWQKVLMVIIGYGAVMIWVALTYRDALGFAKLFSELNARELGLVVVSGGTVGLHFFRSRWEAQGRWGDVQSFAVALQGALFLVTLAAGLNPLLGLYFAVMAVATLKLPALGRKPEVPAE